MIFQNFEIHNIAEIIHNDDGSISWKRVPSFVQDSMEAENKDNVVYNSTGVELRFVLKGDSAKIKMCTYDASDTNSVATFHVFRGSIQGGWQDSEVHKYVSSTPQEFVIEKSTNISHLKTMTEHNGSSWDCEVIRIIFNRGRYKIYGIEGDIEPPKRGQCPKKTFLAYGSSITHGSNALDRSHAWVSLVAHALDMDARNLGMAGSCAIEPETAEYIAQEGEKGNWDIATLELGINVLSWEERKIYNRVENIITQVAGRNPDKPVFVISPFYHCGEAFNENDRAGLWRSIIEEIVKKLDYPNVTYINGLEVLDNMNYMSADEVHPNIYGVARIADVMTTKIKQQLTNK